MNVDSIFNAVETDEKEVVTSANTVIGVNADGSPKTARYPGAYSRPDKASPYENGELANSEIEEKARNGEDALYNDRQPHYEIKHERPEHRIIVFLKAQGLSNKEIAEKTGKSPVCVANVLKQPWARLRLLEEIKSAGRNEVEALFKGAAADAAQVLIDVMADTEAAARDKITAADKVLDRVFGKAVQPMADATAQFEKLTDEQLAKIANGSN